MRLGRLLALSASIAFVGCTGAPEAPPLAQRFVSASDAPGSTIDPEEVRRTAKDVNQLVTVFSEVLVHPDSQAMTAVFEEAGFEQAGTEARFFAEEHAPDVPHVFSSFFELESEDGTASVLEFLVADTKQPCPGSCATTITEFDVDGIPEATGIRRLATEEAVEAAGNPNEVPRDSYWVGFTLGSSVYAMEFAGPPGSVSEEQALEIASAWHGRLAGD